MEPTNLTIPLLVGAAVIDSINPCAFGVLIFLLAYLYKAFGSKKHVLLHGLTYIAAVFVTYLVAGLILLPVIQQLGSFTAGAYIAIAILLIFFGILEIKDFFFYGKGPSLSILPSASKRIEMYTKRITGKLSTSFLLGVFVAIVELPCTGAVYLGVLTLISLAGVTVNNLLLLVIYNLLFVLPLIVILFVFEGASHGEKLEEWRKKYRRHMRLLIGIVLLLIGWWMIAFVL
ncbi:hypothetical protein C4571_02840 [Candidatus Parcubacteria bacterium]|nr:MAG: hypothetical protein C4571_02840 [Candidatus Parcubacteria bacterium]